MGVVAPKTNSITLKDSGVFHDSRYIGRDSNPVSSVQEAAFCYYSQRPNFDVHLYKVTVKRTKVLFGKGLVYLSCCLLESKCNLYLYV